MGNENPSSDKPELGNTRVTLTIIYEDQPSKSVVGVSKTCPSEAEMNAFRQACDKRFLSDAKMLLIRDQRSARAEFFHHSKAYHHFLTNS